MTVAALSQRLAAALGEPVERARPIVARWIVVHGKSWTVGEVESIEAQASRMGWAKP